MSGFVCPNCKCEAELFNASSGGAQKMCDDFKCNFFCYFRSSNMQDASRSQNSGSLRQRLINFLAGRFEVARA